MELIVKHNRANHTHENEQFRRVASSLRILFKQKGWTGLLIGNPYNDTYPRFRADAILLYDFGLFLIDFKAYSGTLVLPEDKRDFQSKPWYAESDQDKSRTVVKAGNSFINPFKQLSYYREAFKEIVANDIYLSGSINQFKTCIVNIFSGPLTIENSVPKSLPFYKICQEADLGNLLYDFSSDNSYTPEAASVLTQIFNAEEWSEHIDLPSPKLEIPKVTEIETHLENEINEFLNSDESGILVLESMAAIARDNWVKYIQSKMVDFTIPQIETWIHSTRIGRIVSARSGIELQSLYSTIYGGASKQDEIVSGDQEEDIIEEHSQDEIPIRSDDSIDQAAVIILHEAHLVSRSLHQSEMLRFGSGRLLEDLLKYLELDKTKRKLICVGDPYSLTYGKDIDSALNLNTLSELTKIKIRHYRQILDSESGLGKSTQKIIFANAIESKIFNNLSYTWNADDLVEISKEDIPNILTKWFGNTIDSDPSKIVMVYLNKDAKKTNNWIKSNCIKNGNSLAKKDLLLINNNVNIPDLSGFGQPTKLYNGMFLLVENVNETIDKRIVLRNKQEVILSFTKLKVKCLSLPSKLSTDIWMLNNYFKSEDKLSKEEQIAFRIFVNNMVAAEVKEQPFVNSPEFIQLSQDESYKQLYITVNELLKKMKNGEKVKTLLEENQRALRKIERNYEKKFKKRIFSKITLNDPFVNAIFANYGWALTVHKCVGLNFSESIINGYQGENRGVSNAEYFRWLYSGITTTTGLVRIVNPQEINPLMNVQFEDASINHFDDSKQKKSIVYTSDYNPEPRFFEKVKILKNQNVVGSICELAKLLEKNGILLESVISSSEFLTKVNFSNQKQLNSKLIVLFDNKGGMDDFAVSSIRIAKNSGFDDILVNNAIQELFSIKKAPFTKNSLAFPSDFRAQFYSNWVKVLGNEGFKLELAESKQYQDVFNVTKNESFAKFRVWYKDDGFFSKFIVFEKSDDNIVENIKKWCLNGN